MKITVKVVGLWKLVEKMGNTGCGVVEFPAGTTNDLFRHLLAQHGFVWADFPLLEKWEENINLSIVHNDDILLKADYGRTPLADGDKVSLYVQTGCC